MLTQASLLRFSISFSAACAHRWVHISTLSPTAAIRLNKPPLCSFFGLLIARPFFVSALPGRGRDQEIQRRPLIRSPRVYINRKLQQLYAPGDLGRRAY
ncbi:uncharacterized protein LACBIDRAFT_299446 [Laccaria bicolor S238N-H82]|uniref:Predicted protein n=1 Tax=Laccaria bicolor (strain S238N-H82 / ATCC MYA-4686) TaxID=486041 RepID=B0DEQ7_LACBS|nr:uncharacterized protein LACBIDRAFT_299446 [Laccaria bicolor S238N-H82]EDR06981.1 predicted protein [Laccaria bicolor S238N-H82]|eukprot:XP_001882354.1 predicted protein [Laccaria bicolor S238N-H82]